MIRLGTRAAEPGEAELALRAARRRPLAWIALVLALPLIAAAPAKPGRQPPVRQTPSGLPVPRYVSLKFNEVNARAGPGDDYKLLWTYRARGLPLQVIAETAEWRRVCDPEGAVAWVHQRTLDNRRTVMRVEETPTPLRRRPAPTSRPVALLQGRSLAALDGCKNGWCRIAAGRVKGWTPADAIWGVAETPQCRPRIAIAR